MSVVKITEKANTPSVASDANFLITQQEDSVEVLCRATVEKVIEALKIAGMAAIDDISLLVKNIESTGTGVKITYYNDTTEEIKLSVNTVGYINFASGVIDEGVIGAADEIAREYESFGYVTEGLEYFFDGELKDDTGQYDMGWLNLATGTLHSFMGTETRNENSFGFDKATYLSMGSDGKYENPTIEVVFKPSAVSSSEIDIINDFESGGFGLNMTSAGRFTVNIGGTYYTAASDTISADTLYTLSGSYDGETIRLVQNGENFEYAKEGSIKHSSVELEIGRNASTSTSSYYFSGEIYCVRVYNRALSVEEIAQNQEIDKERFGVEF